MRVHSQLLRTSQLILHQNDENTFFQLMSTTGKLLPDAPQLRQLQRDATKLEEIQIWTSVEKTELKKQFFVYKTGSLIVTQNQKIKKTICLKKKINHILLCPYLITQQNGLLNPKKRF